MENAWKELVAGARWLHGRVTRRAWRFLRFLARQFAADRAPSIAASLAFVTLLALVPLTAVILSVLTAFPIFQDVAEQIQDFAFEHFVPGVGDAVQDHLQEFIERAGQLTAVGVMFLVIAALLLMNTIDQTFNDIWGIRERRHPVALFMVYWAVLTLGPLLIGFSVAISSYLFSLPFLADLPGELGVRERLLALIPFVFSVLAFTLLYAVVPNRPIPWHNALIGGTVAALLFEIAKWGFAHYVAIVPTYELVYGALSTLPFLMVWLYLVWLIILLGVEISRCLTVYPREAAQDAIKDPLVAAYRCLGHLYEAQQRGEELGLMALLRWEPRLSEHVVYNVMQQLMAQRLVHCTADGDWVLARDLDYVTLLDLYLALTDLPPRPPDVDATAGDEPLTRLMGAGWRGLTQHLATPLSELYGESGRETAEPPARQFKPRVQ